MRQSRPWWRSSDRAAELPAETAQNSVAEMSASSLDDSGLGVSFETRLNIFHWPFHLLQHQKNLENDRLWGHFAAAEIRPCIARRGSSSPPLDQWVVKKFWMRN